MTRKTKRLVVPEWGGRDAGHIFVITEMPALDAERWAWRLALVVKGTEAEIPADLAKLGMVGVAIRGINSMLAAEIDWPKLKVLLDEMLQCVKIVRDPVDAPDLATDLVGVDDIEEVRTIGWLRSEVLELHTNFSFTEALWKWIETWNSRPPDLPIT